MSDTIIQLKAGHYALDPRLTRVPVSHKNFLSNQKYDVKKLLKWDAPRTWKWDVDIILDQGNLGSCTGNAAAYMLAAKPKVVTEVFGIPMGEAAAVKLYEVAKENDSYPGEDYEGSDSNGAAKACVLSGKIGKYHWAFEAMTMAIVCSQKKPIVMGSNWYAMMMDVDSNQFVHATGKLQGGHEFMLHGFDVEGNFFWGKQSWGEGWSENAEFKISFADVEKLLALNGDCWIPDALSV